MKEWFMVAIGGMLGSLLRHGANQLATHSLGDKFPLGTLIANVLGCFLIGLGWSLATRYGWVGGPWEIAYRVGFLGGLTTFSSYGLDIVRNFQDAQPMTALAILVANLLLGLVAVAAGMAIVR